MAVKTANVLARIEPDIKMQAEEIPVSYTHLMKSRKKRDSDLMTRVIFL